METVEETQEISLQDVAEKLDQIGAQLNWLCENLAQLFGFVQQMGSQGGGIRGMLKALKQEAPGLIPSELSEQQIKEGLDNAG